MKMFCFKLPGLGKGPIGREEGGPDSINNIINFYFLYWISPNNFNFNNLVNPTNKNIS